MNQLLIIPEIVLTLGILILFVLAGVAWGFGYFAGKDAQRRRDLK